MQYSLSIEKRALKFLQSLGSQDKERLVDALNHLQTDPRPPGCKKLKGRDAWRIRVGSYRILYEIQDKILHILVVAIGDRKEVYR